MLQYAEYAVAFALACVLLWTLGDVISERWRARCLRRKRDAVWREMEQRIEFWQKYDREFGQQQRRIRRGE